MEADSLRALRDEFRAVGLGPELQARVAALARRAVKRYPASIYARSGQWDEDALSDVVQDVYASLLDGHLARILDQVRTQAGFDYFIREHTKDLVASRRQRTIIDNLLERSRES